MLGYLQAHDGVRPGDGGRVLFVPVPSTKRLPSLLARACAEAVVGGEVLDVLLVFTVTTFTVTTFAATSTFTAVSPRTPPAASGGRSNSCPPPSDDPQH